MLRPARLSLALFVLATPLAAEEPDAAASAAAAASSVERWLGAFSEGGGVEARETLLVALDLAGDAGVEVLLASLDEGQGQVRNAHAAWALGQALRSGPLQSPRTGALRDRAVAVLRRELSSVSPDARLAAASSLGLLEAREAEGDLLDLLLSPGLTPEAEDVLLVALAGLRGSALSLLEGRLERGGGEDWAAATTGSFLRWGGSSWPELLRFARESGDASVRATALTCLLLLAEPASACALAELYGSEPEPLLRRVLLQALAATRHPLARDHLDLVARTEQDAQLREIARVLSAGLSQERDRRREAGEGPRRSVPELLAELERKAGFGRKVVEVEQRADPVHAAMIATVLRRLPMREDGRRLEDHARLAQVRARLLCLDGIDCASD